MTVTGVNDDLVNGTQTTTITLTINDVSSDNDFDGVADQAVTVTGVNDDLVNGTQTTTITLTINDVSSDNDFDGVADQAVSATTTDDDTAGFTVAESSESTGVAETGSTDTFTVVLDAQPASDVVISVSSGDTGEATVSPATLTLYLCELGYSPKHDHQRLKN